MRVPYPDGSFMSLPMQQTVRIGAAQRSMAIAALLGAVVLGQPASAQSGRQCGPDAIGLARTHEIDARGGPRFGTNQYPGRDFLKPGEVVLTFDDGPHKVLTRRILDTLDAHCTRATFFMVGQRALYYPDMTREVASRGHTIATHTWSHQDLAKIAPEAARAELELGISGVQKALGVAAAPFFRFPYLSAPKEVTAHLRTRNTGIFSIDIDSYDFKTRSPTVVIRNVMQQLERKGRGIILFHDIQPSTAGALDTLLSELKRKGYKVVHIVSRQPQTTLAEFDRRIGRDFNSRRLAALPPPVGQRGIVSPAWEVRIIPAAGSAPWPAVPAVAGPPGPTGRPTRPAVGRDWQTTTFGGQ